MKSVFVLHHSYELDGYDETKLIGVYTSNEEAQLAIERLIGKPGFRNYPDAFGVTEYELDKDHWLEGFVTITTIMVKDIHGNWKAVTAAVEPGDAYIIIEKYQNDLLGEFKDGDIVSCELRDGELYAVEKRN